MQKKWLVFNHLSIFNKKNIFFSPSIIKYSQKNVQLELSLKSFLDKEIYFLHNIFCSKSSLYGENFLSEMTGVHFPAKSGALVLKIILRNLSAKETTIYSFVFETNYEIPSVSSLFKAANWLERELFDMFGICFYNHKNLRRILTDYGFKGFPLLKNFPVYGFKELRFDLQNQQLIYTPVILTQKWRNYLFLRQWN